MRTDGCVDGYAPEHHETLDTKIKHRKQETRKGTYVNVLPDETPGYETVGFRKGVLVR